MEVWNFKIRNSTRQFCLNNLRSPRVYTTQGYKIWWIIFQKLYFHSLTMSLLVFIHHSTSNSSHIYPHIKSDCKKMSAKALKRWCSQSPHKSSCIRSWISTSLRKGQLPHCPNKPIKYSYGQDLIQKLLCHPHPSIQEIILWIGTKYYSHDNQFWQKNKVSYVQKTKKKRAKKKPKKA